jgi:ligand-binding sensor domain-containing protein
MRFSIVFALIFCSQHIYSQSDIAIGEWSSFLPHRAGNRVAQSDEKIIYATSGSIFTIDKDDMSIEYLSKVEGLTETGISEIVYDDFNDQLIVAYENSVFDIISGPEIMPVFDIKNNTNFIDRRINKLFVQNDQWLYIATGFGLLQYNLENQGFGFTLDAGQLISDVSGNDEKLVMLGDDGVYVLDFQNEIFPNAFTSWKRVSNGLPLDYEAKAVLVRNNKVYIATDEYVYGSNDFETFTEVYENSDPSFNALLLDDVEDGWIFGVKNTATSASKVLFFDNEDTPINEVSSCVNRLLDVEVDEKGRIFFADEFSSIRFIDENGACQKETYRGPFNLEATDIAVKNETVYVASGGVTEQLADKFSRNGVYLLEGGEWNNINQDNEPFFKDNNIVQFYQIEAHPRDDKFYIGSFWSGLIEYNEETGDRVLYSDANNNTDGALGSAVGDEQRTRISGLTFDSNNNLWMASYNASKPLVVLTDEGTWHSFEINSDTKLTDIVADDLGNVWGVIGGNTGGVVVYNTNQTISDPTDDPPSKLFNINNSEVPSNLVNAIAKDQDGTIWVGTAQGVVAFECGGSVFESSCVGNKRKVLQDSIAAFLLETEDVQAIAVDGANRKWFGTRNGIFVQSPSGEQQVAKFDVENSPLFDNNIKSMAYNEKTGEMYIASNRGLQSYRTATTGAKNTHSSNVYAFPNPVRPEYQGSIAIKGLARDAEVKITDIDGQLVFQTEALGGQAIWDGRDINGREVTGGVYLVFSSSSDSFRDPDSFVTKIMVIR